MKTEECLICKAPLEYLTQDEIMAVSYTHLDVYKRQEINCSRTIPMV